MNTTEQNNIILIQAIRLHWCQHWMVSHHLVKQVVLNQYSDYSKFGKIVKLMQRTK